MATYISVILAYKIALHFSKISVFLISLSWINTFRSLSLTSTSFEITCYMVASVNLINVQVFTSVIILDHVRRNVTILVPIQIPAEPHFAILPFIVVLYLLLFSQFCINTKIMFIQTISFNLIN